MATYVRTHTPGDAGSSGTTIAATTAAVTIPGDTLIAIIAADDDREVTGLSKPGGETASWVRTAHGTGGNTLLEVWAIKTTVSWAAALAVTATLSGACTGRAITLVEYAGVATTVQTAVVAGVHFGSSITVATDHDVVAGDLLLYAVVANTAAVSGKRVSLATSPSGTSIGITVGTDSRRPGYRLEALAALVAVTGAGSMSVTYAPTTYGGAPDADDMSAVIVGLKSDDYPPDTPDLTSNAAGGTVDRGRPIRLGWTFSSANASDAQSARDLFIRLEGDTSWTTLASGNSTATIYDIPAGDLSAGNWEWQARTYGALGKPSPRSSSGYFTTADAPDGPTITYPVPGQTLDQFETVRWSVPAQDSYQLRRVADDGDGNPDPDVIYDDTGEVPDPTARELPRNFSVNNRAEHIQLRVKDDDLWSDWDDVLGNVDYSPPPTPTRVFYPDPSNGALLVTITNPDPEGDDPAAVSNDIWIDDGNGSERRATGLPTNGSWLYATPVSGRDYGAPGALRVEAVAANGTTSSSS